MCGASGTHLNPDNSTSSVDSIQRFYLSGITKEKGRETIREQEDG
jgi:hypothetical protein